MKLCKAFSDFPTRSSLKSFQRCCQMLWVLFTLSALPVHLLRQVYVGGVQGLFLCFLGVFFELRFCIEKTSRKSSKNGRFWSKKSIQNRYKKLLRIDVEKRVDFRITLLSFFMPEPCEISVLPRREHDFTKITLFAWDVTSVEKAWKNRSKFDEKSF